MGRWTNFSGIDIGVNDLESAISEILEEYGDIIYQATEEGLDAATKVLIENLKSATPKRTGKFRKGWKRKKKYKLRRFVGNTTTVEMKRKGGGIEEISLANIFEYSTTRGNPFIKRTFENSINEMAQAVVNEIKKEA